MKNKFYNKGFKMALPFIAGLAVGSAVVIAYNNKKKIKEALYDGIEKSRDVASDIKEYAEEKMSKKATKKTAKKETTKQPTKKATTRKPRSSSKKTTTRTKTAKVVKPSTSEQKDS